MHIQYTYTSHYPRIPYEGCRNDHRLVLSTTSHYQRVLNTSHMSGFLWGSSHSAPAMPHAPVPQFIQGDPPFIPHSLFLLFYLCEIEKTLLISLRPSQAGLNLFKKLLGARVINEH